MPRGAVSRNSVSFAYDGASVSCANSWSASTSRSTSPSRSKTRRVHAPVKSRHWASSHAARRSRSIGVSSRVAAEPLPDRSPERAPHAFGRRLQLRLDPGPERLVEQPLRLRFGQDREQRIDARLDRTLAQQLGAEPVNGADVRFLE